MGWETFALRSKRELMLLVSQIDATLDSGLTGKEVSYNDASWDDFYKRNGIALPVSEYDLDTIDWTFCCLTGIGCGVLDLSRQCASVLENENVHKKFDEMSKDYLQKVTGSKGSAAIDNHKGGPLHRLVGPSHDLSRFLETIGNLVKGEFHANVEGNTIIATAYSGRSTTDYLKIDSPADAAVVLILHLIGDFFSAMSLPIPGRTKIAESDVQQVVKDVFDEYRSGGNLRKLVSEFLSNIAGAVLIPIVLRLYRYVRIAIEKRSVPKLSLKNDGKFHLLARNAQTISFTISIGRAAFTQNPLALNYLNFVQIVRNGAAINRITKGEQERLLANISNLSRRIEEL
jgi:hypothetical protein